MEVEVEIEFEREVRVSMRVLQVAEGIGNSFQAGKGVRARSWLGCNWAGTTDDRSQADIDPDLEIPQKRVELAWLHKDCTLAD